VNVERNLGSAFSAQRRAGDTFNPRRLPRRADGCDLLDVYAQYGRAEENAIVSTTPSVRRDGGQPLWHESPTTVDIFRRGTPICPTSARKSSILTGAVRDQLVTSAIISGDSSDVFELPAAHRLRLRL
jgi:hypothetical protein